MPGTFLSNARDPAAAGTVDRRLSLASLERRAEPFRETMIRLHPEARIGLVRWSRRLEPDADFLRVQFRMLEADRDGAMPFARPSEFTAASGTVRVIVSPAGGTLRIETAGRLEDGRAARYLGAQAAAWVKAHYPNYTLAGDAGSPGGRVADLPADWDRDAVEEVAPDTLVAELRAARERAAALEERLPVLCDERNLLRERIVHLTAGCVVLGGVALMMLVRAAL